MGKLKADLSVDSKDFVSGVENAEQALETLIDSMDDAEKESLRSTERIEKGLKDVTEAAKDTSKSTRVIGKGFKDASQEASEGMDDLKENSRSNAKEVAASFDGSIESIVDGFQGLAAEAFEGFGVAGIAAGVLVASGIGLATAAFQQNAEQAEAAKQKIRDLGVAIVESGGDTATLEYIQDNLKLIVSNSDDAEKKFSELVGFSKRFRDFGDDVGTLALGFAGNTDAAEMMIEKLDDEIRALEETNTLSNEQNEINKRRKAELQGLSDELQTVTDNTKQAQDVEAQWLASGGAEIQGKAAAIATVNAAYDDAVGSILDFKNEETGMLDVDAFIAAMEERKTQLANYQTDLATMGLTTEQKKALDAMGIEAASAYLQGIKAGTPEQAKYLRDSLTEAAKDSSGQAKGVLEEAFKKPVSAKVEAEADTKQAEKDLVAFLNKPRSMTVTVIGKTREGKVVM